MPDASGDFNRPVYSGELFQEPKPSPLEVIKPHVGKIALAIAAIIVVYIAYWFFIGSYHNVTVSITGKDGIEVAAISGEIVQGGKILENIGSKTSRFRLKEGDYTIEVRADGMSSESVPFTVGGKDSAESVVMEKDTDCEVSGIQLPKSAGDEIYTGSNPAIIMASSNGAEDTVEIILEADSGISLKTAVAQNTIPAGASNFPISAEINVAENISIKNNTGDSKTLKFRIKGTSKKFEKTVTLKKRANVTVSTIPNLTITAGDRTSKEFTITNKEKYALEGRVAFTIKPSPKYNQALEVREWFSIIPESIEKLSPGSTRVTIELDVPSSAQGDDFSVEFSAGAENQSWASSIQVFDVKIEGAKTLLEAKLKSATAAPKQGQPGIPNTITLTNNTDFVIEDIEVNVEPECYEIFIKDMTPVFIDSLSNQAPANTKTITFNSVAPLDARINEEKPCNITISYTDPLRPAEIMPIPDLIMKITPKPA